MAIVAEIQSGGYDLVVRGSRGRGRANSEILGSVNAHVHYRVKVPRLTIDPAEPSEENGTRIRKCRFESCACSAVSSGGY